MRAATGFSIFSGVRLALAITTSSITSYRSTFFIGLRLLALMGKISDGLL